MITRRAAGILVPLALLAACTTERTGTPTSPPTSPSGPSTDTLDFGTPSVTEPLDGTAFLADPCSGLTPEQQAEFGVGGGTERTVENGPKCDYSGAEAVSVLFSDKDTGLSYLYGLQESGTWATWEPFELDGYPAVTYVKNAGKTCDVAVGLSDESYFSVAVPLVPGDDLDCARARDWAARVLETVRAG